MKKYRVIQGAYIGTTDDRRGRWYIDDTTSRIIDKRGRGMTRKDAVAECKRLNAAL